MNAIISKLIDCAGKFVIAVSILALLYSCREQKPLDIEVSEDVPGPVFSRMERDIFSDNRPEIDEILAWRTKYGSFFDIYVHRILRLPAMSDSSLALAFRDFVNNKDIMEIRAAVDSQYSDLHFLEEDLTQAFRLYAHYFPEKHTPQVVSYISGLELSIACTDSVLGIGLDLYLGQDFPLYRAIALPLYRTRRMNKSHLAVDAMKGWGQTEFEPAEMPKDMLSHMIFNGKVLYFLDAMFPDKHDSLKIGYTGKQLEFCEENEERIWTHLVEKKLLFSTDFQQYGKFVSDGPTTSGLPRESPAMIGSWTGWQIVRKYMKIHPELSLAQLMKDHDAQKILGESKYKPR